MRIEGQRARDVRGLPAGDRRERWGALVTGVWTQRFADMWYVVTSLALARIDVRPSNGLGAVYKPALRSQICERGSVMPQSSSGKVRLMLVRHPAA